MALPPVLSTKGLAKFRTKLCERLLASGTCTFGDKCQYSHAERPRRNPLKHNYVSHRCPDPDCNATGCSFAHTEEEILYHPQTYKTRMCAADSCSGYYCPHAHCVEELRNQVCSNEFINSTPSKQPAALVGFTPSPVSRPSNRRTQHNQETEIETERPLRTAGSVCFRRSRRGGQCSMDTGTHFQSEEELLACTEPASEPPPDGESSWWYPGAQNDLCVSHTRDALDIDGDGDCLVGGNIRQGVYKGNSPCQVKLVSINRGDSQIASQVVKETKRWISRGADERGIVICRTVATTFLALPDRPSTLGKSVGAMKPTLAQRVKAWKPLSAVAADWTRQIMLGVQKLHEEGIAHMCLGPQTIMVDATGNLHIGDFLFKIKLLRLLSTDERIATENVAMWYPPEFHHVYDHNQKGHNFEVDAWQVGIVLFYLLTGQHLFGSTRTPAMVCKNIVSNKRENEALLQHMPLFHDLVMRLTNPDAGRRLEVRMMYQHPVLWNLPELVRRCTDQPDWVALVHEVPIGAMLGIQATSDTSQSVRDELLRSLHFRDCAQFATDLLPAQRLKSPTENNAAGSTTPPSRTSLKQLPLTTPPRSTSNENESPKSLESPSVTCSSGEVRLQPPFRTQPVNDSGFRAALSAPPGLPAPDQSNSPHVRQASRPCEPCSPTAKATSSCSLPCSTLGASQHLNSMTGKSVLSSTPVLPPPGLMPPPPAQHSLAAPRGNTVDAKPAFQQANYHSPWSPWASQPWVCDSSPVAFSPAAAAHGFAAANGFGVNTTSAAALAATREAARTQWSAMSKFNGPYCQTPDSLCAWSMSSMAGLAHQSWWTRPVSNAWSISCSSTSSQCPESAAQPSASSRPPAMSLMQDPQWTQASASNWLGNEDRLVAMDSKLDQILHQLQKQSQTSQNTSFSGTEFHSPPTDLLTDTGGTTKRTIYRI